MTRLRAIIELLPTEARPEREREREVGRDKAARNECASSCALVAQEEKLIVRKHQLRRLQAY